MRRTSSSVQRRSSASAFAKQCPVQTGKAEAPAWSARVVASADAEWVVTAPTGGVVVRVPVVEGQQVAANTVLAELRSASLPDQGAALAQARSAAALARGNRDRDRTLHAEGLIAERRVRESENAAVQADAALTAVQSGCACWGCPQPMLPPVAYRCEPRPRQRYSNAWCRRGSGSMKPMRCCDWPMHASSCWN
jgi:multidrug resistance efflux pump